MFPASFWAPRFFNANYWAKVGGSGPAFINPGWGDVLANVVAPPTTGVLGNTVGIIEGNEVFGFSTNVSGAGGGADTKPLYGTKTGTLTKK